MSKVKHFETVSGKIVKTAEFDGYSIADRLLEGLMFQISVQEDGTLKASVKEKDKAYFSDFNQEKFLKLAVDYAYTNDIFYDPNTGEECCIIFEGTVKDINDMAEEDDETEEDDFQLTTISASKNPFTKKTDEVEEEVKEPIIGDYKPKRKFLSFVSSVNGAKVRFIRDIAFVKGEKLSGLLDGVIFKVTICDEGTIKFEEEVEDGKEPVSNPEMIKRLIGDIDDIDVTGYANKFVVSGLPFADIDGKLCYLEVEHKKPIDVLASIFAEKDKEEENMNLSEKGLSVLDQLFADEEKTDKVNSILDKLFSDDEDSLDQVMNSDLEDITEVEVVEEPKVESYMEESFRKMNEQKVKELNSRIEEKQKDIFKLKSEIKQAETKVTETSEQLGILETRLETMTPGDKPNGYVFFVSEEQKLETGLDETTRNIADKIADIMKLKKDVLFDYLTGSFYNIKIAKKDDITKELELNKEFQKLFSEKIKTMDIEGSFSVQAEKDVIEYRGKLNWHQLVSKFIRNGFEQDVEFDKLSGSNSYETKTEEVQTPTETVTDSDFDEVKTETKSSTTKEFMTIGEWNTPTDLVVLGTSAYNDKEFKEVLSITDGTTSLDIRRGGKKMKAFNSIETAGSFSVITFVEYQSFINEIDEDELEFMSGVFDTLMLPKFVGKLEIGIKQNGNWVTDKSILSEEYVQNLSGVEQILLNIQEGQKVIQIEDHVNYQKSDSKEEVSWDGTIIRKVGDYKVLDSYSKPTDFVIVGGGANGRDIEITDDYYSVDLYLNGSPVKLSKWGSAFETEGHVSFMTINRYKQWVKEFGEDSGGVEAILVTDFCGDITVGCKTEDGFSTDFDFSDYILHQVEDGEEVIINLINNSTETGIHQITNHDLNKIVPYVRDMKLKEILGEK
jgi:hypothetical protein